MTHDATRTLPGFPSLESLLSAIIDSSDDGIISKDLNGTVTSWNRAAERIFGYTAEEMIGQSVLRLIPQDLQTEEAEILRKIRSGERVDHFDTRRQRKDGSLVEVSLTISPVKNAEGQIMGASKVVRDITSRRRTEAALQAEKKKLQVLNRLGLDLTGEKDVQKVVQAVTDAGRELSGAAFGAFFYNVVNAQGESYMLYTLSGAPREAFEKFGMPRNTPIFEPTFSGQGPVRIDDVLQDPRYGRMAPHHGMPKGHLPVRSYLAVPVVSQNQSVIGGLFFGHPEPGIFTSEAETLVIAVAVHAAMALDNAKLYASLQAEVEQQRAMQKALQESEELSSSILNSTADCVKVLDLEGRLLSMNPPGAKLCEIDDFESVRLKPWVEIWPEEMRGRVTAAIEVALRGETGRFQGPGITAKGTVRWWDVLVTPLRDATGRITRLTSTSRDVSEQRRAEEAVRQSAEEVIRQSRLKDEFLATLSHELRTPLQSILGWTQILQMDDVTAEDLKQGLEVIDRSARAQTRIIEDLLDMSRILSGKVRLDVQKMEIGPLIDNTLETLKPAAQAKGIRLSAMLDPLARPISGDPARVQQIFWNLLNNAIKFTPQGGRVQILLERVNSHLEVAVTDTGRGITPDFLPHVFERFRQADSTSTREHGGLGLGLAIVKHLIELHGGTARVKSAGLGQGSTFIVTFPLLPLHSEPADEPRRHPASPEGELPEIPLPRLDGVKVIVVDDEADARGAIARMLTLAGAVVRTEGSMTGGLELLAEAPADVLISDIGMHPQDGYEFIRAVRALPANQGGNIPAVALTAYTRAEDRIKAITEGFQMHLAKPVHALELLTIVASLARTRFAGDRRLEDTRHKT
jgi:PAS domain S-box-containing protein